MLAEVEAVGKAPSQSRDSHRRRDVARLRMLEVWKGTKPERLEVDFDLAPNADELHARYDSAQRKGARISPQQQKLLADAFVKAPSSDGTLSLMLTLLDGYPSKAVDDAALSVMEMTLQGSEWLLGDMSLAMKLIARRLGKPLVPPEEAVEEATDDTYEAMTARLKHQWEAFKKANHLLPAPLRKPLTRGPSGVGRETPP